MEKKTDTNKKAFKNLVQFSAMYQQDATGKENSDRTTNQTEVNISWSARKMMFNLSGTFIPFSNYKPDLL